MPDPLLLMLLGSVLFFGSASTPKVLLWETIILILAATTGLAMVVAGLFMIVYPAFGWRGTLITGACLLAFAVLWYKAYQRASAQFPNGEYHPEQPHR